MRKTSRTRPAVVLLALGCLACSARLAAQCGGPLDLGRGPIGFKVPDGYDPALPTPLVVVLHTFAGTGAGQERYLRIEGLADTFGFLYAYPDGSLDADGNRFWNATDVCCDLFDTGVDDSSYLRGLIEAVADRCNVDRRRVYFIGQSNGAYMSYRMACDHAETLAGIVTIAGATYFDPAACAPSRPIHVLHIHGTEDRTWNYEGGTFVGNRYPGAVGSATRWAGYNRCRGPLEPVPGRLDLEREIPGEESRVDRFSMCAAGGSVELWTTEGGGHIFELPPDFSLRVIAHLLARPAPPCRGQERIQRAVCRERQGKLVVKLAGGLRGDGFEVRLSGGRTIAGRLNDQGRARLGRRNVDCGRESTVAVTWGCGASASAPLD